MMAFVVANLVSAIIVAVLCWHVAGYVIRRRLGEIHVDAETLYIDAFSVDTFSADARRRFLEGQAADLARSLAAKMGDRSIVSIQTEIHEDWTAHRWIVKVSFETVALRRRPTIVTYDPRRETRHAA